MVCAYGYVGTNSTCLVGAWTKSAQRLTKLGWIEVLINHELMNIVSYCDGKFICICGICNPPVSHGANALQPLCASVQA